MWRRNFLLGLAGERWRIEQKPGLVQIVRGGETIAGLHTSREWDKPFLHPLRAVDGTELSRGWPVAAHADDHQDHAWHRGLWWGHGVLNGEDFWRERPGASGFIRTSRASGRQRGGRFTLQGEHQLETRSGQRIAGLSTTWTIWDEDRLRLIDFSLALRGEGALRFGDTDDGGTGVRLREEFREDRGARLVNAEGLRGAGQMWGKPSAWTHYEAMVAGRTYGVAMMSHPTNLRHPAGWHARNYGLNSANPFAVSSFAGEKNGERGAWELAAGGVLRLRYRVVLHAGPAPDWAGRFAAWTREGD
jgi:hypothetical protein